MAASGTRAAADDAGDWVPQRGIGWAVRATARCIPSSLNETGIIEGRHVAIEYRWAEGQYDRLPALATDLVGRRVVVIVAWTDAAALAAKATTTTIPIVFLTGSDPVRFGLVSSLNRPGENITGVSWFGIDLVPKQLSLLHELVPNATIIALLVEANVPEAVSQVSEVQAAARSLGLQLVALNVRNASDIDTALSNSMRERASALVVGAGGFFTGQRGQIIALAARYAIPPIYGFREYRPTAAWSVTEMTFRMPFAELASMPGGFSK